MEGSGVAGGGGIHEQTIPWRPPTRLLRRLRQRRRGRRLQNGSLRDGLQLGLKFVWFIIEFYNRNVSKSSNKFILNSSILFDYRRIFTFFTRSFPLNFFFFSRTTPRLDTILMGRGPRPPYAWTWPVLIEETENRSEAPEGSPSGRRRMP